MSASPSSKGTGLIRPVRPEDGHAIADIYNPYVRDTDISFETEPVSAEEIMGRIARVTADYPWIVYESDGDVLGYAYAARWKERTAYRYCAETTIYLRSGYGGRGLGAQLYQALLARLPDHDVKIALGCIALPNFASVALHEKLGFVATGIIPAVGFKFGRWIDIGYWRKELTNPREEQP